MFGSDHDEELLKIINQDTMDDYVQHRIPSDHTTEHSLSNRVEGYNSDSDGSEASDCATPGETFDVQQPVASSRPSRRMSMRMPSFSAFHVSVADEKENAAFLEELTNIITEFPIPPSHDHTVSAQTSINVAYNNISDIVGLSSKTAIKVVADGWGAVTKFAGKFSTGGSAPRKSNAGDAPTAPMSMSGMER